MIAAMKMFVLLFMGQIVTAYSSSVQPFPFTFNNMFVVEGHVHRYGLPARNVSVQISAGRGTRVAIESEQTNNRGEFFVLLPLDYMHEDETRTAQILIHVSSQTWAYTRQIHVFMQQGSATVVIDANPAFGKEGRRRPRKKRVVWYESESDVCGENANEYSIEVSQRKLASLGAEIRIKHTSVLSLLIVVAICMSLKSFTMRKRSRRQLLYAARRSSCDVEFSILPGAKYGDIGLGCDGEDCWPSMDGYGDGGALILLD